MENSGLFWADGNRKQALCEHLNGVRQKTSKFAKDFRSEEWGELLADLHDLGKFTKEFQQYMLENGPRVEHASVGGLYATEQFDDPLRKLVLQFSITCHHTGLQDSVTLKKRLSGATKLLQSAKENIPAELLGQKIPDWPEWLRPPSVGAEKQFNADLNSAAS